jgi:sugar/nucleoside kinase (ribokinase family)
MNEAETVDVRLNVLAERGPQIPLEYLDSRYVFLANTHPELQYDIARRLSAADLIVCDTMNLWIETEPAALRRTLSIVHGLVLNDGEARLLTGEQNLARAGRKLLELGPRFAVIKKGEHGGLLFERDYVFIVPPYPTQHTVDPTGCGDTFAGAFMGYVASRGSTDAETLRAGVARGSVVASFVIESFSVDALARVTPSDVEARLEELRGMARFH